MFSFLNKPVYASIFIYVVSLFVLYVTKPSLCFDKNNEIEVISYDGNGFEQDVRYKRIDAFVQDRVSSVELIKKSGLPLKLVGAPIQVIQNSFPFVRNEKNKTLLEEVERIRNAINMYKIKGAKGLKEALQGTIGAVVANQNELKNATTTNDDVIQRLGELIDKMDSFASRALKIKKALSTPIKFVLEKLSEPEKSLDIENET